MAIFRGTTSVGSAVDMNKKASAGSPSDVDEFGFPPGMSPHEKLTSFGSKAPPKGFHEYITKAFRSYKPAKSTAAPAAPAAAPARATPPPPGLSPSAYDPGKAKLGGSMVPGTFGTSTAGMAPPSHKTGSYVSGPWAGTPSKVV
jgi:hypothetical protein